MKAQAQSKQKMLQRDFIKLLAIACMTVAVISGAVLGLWEQAHPFFGHARYQVVASPLQLWSYCVLQVFKSIGFLAGLFGFFLIATRRGILLKIVMGAAVLGGAFFAIIWTMIAVTARDDAVYVLKHPIGSDMHSNGGALFLWFAPIALGIAALLAHRISRWKSIWAIIVGLLGSRIFGLLAPGLALVVEGLIWLVFGCIVYNFRGGAQ